MTQGEHIIRVFGDLNSVLHSLGLHNVAELHLDYATYQALEAALETAYPKTTSLLHDAGGMKLAGVSIKCVT